MLALALSGGAMAQNGNDNSNDGSVHHSRRMNRMTQEQMTEKMVSELHLDGKQAKKVAKLNKKYKTLIEGEAHQAKSGQRPPMGQGRPDGNGGGGRPDGGGFGGGMPGGMGGHGGFGGGMPRGGMSGHGGDMQGGGPRGGMPPSGQQQSEYDYDKQQAKYDKQIRKILSDEQYEGYLKLKPQFVSQRRTREFLMGGNGEMGMPPGGGHHQPKEGALSKDGIGLSEGSQTLSGQSLTSEATDENAVQVKGGSLILDGCHIYKKGGDSQNGDATSFYGINSAVVATGKGVITMSGGDITTNATGANGVVAYGGTVNISDASIRCEKNLSRGIHATGGGAINARNLHIVTCGNNSSVIATDRGGGTVNVVGGIYKTSGKDCAVCYSTGNITVQGIEGESEQGEIAVIEGDNEVNIIDCQMTSGDNRRGMLILQSGSGDAEGYNGRISVTGGHLTLTSPKAPLVEVTTRMEGTLTLKDVALDVPSGMLMRVDYNSRWRTTNPVATLNLKTDSTATYNGNIEVDESGTSTVVIDKNVVWNGAYDTADTGKQTTVIVSGTWNLTADSCVDNVIIKDGGIINRNGYQLKTKS